ncbi:hypothetical protein BDK92_6401 [Micromonospora pisi]|uniref:Uncharacterized protein n=1 Tax=Micromonospora pisi TaxID=589240 RepID=A0A495JSJ3_9ACTN|nr:hypothetical protein [Micromonospora pisi]RKR91970.1 hypothetical protein BDK92_6401 [Micromonospora pisi]
MTSDAERMVREALRVTAQHANGGRCEQCTDTGCPALTKVQGLTKPGEW